MKTLYTTVRVIAWQYQRFEDGNYKGCGHKSGHSHYWSYALLIQKAFPDVFFQWKIIFPELLQDIETGTVTRNWIFAIPGSRCSQSSEECPVPVIAIGRLDLEPINHRAFLCHRFCVWFIPLQEQECIWQYSCATMVFGLVADLFSFLYNIASGINSTNYVTVAMLGLVLLRLTIVFKATWRSRTDSDTDMLDKGQESEV